MNQQEKRKTLVQMFMDGATMADIATAIGSTANGVASRISQLRKRGLAIPKRPRGGSQEISEAEWRELQDIVSKVKE